MKTWTKDIEINAPIEKVWSLLDGSLENMQKIMPQVIENTPIKETENKIGSITRQKYKEGKRVEEYDVITTAYKNEPDQKELKIEFTLAKMFEITAHYELKKLDDNRTYLRYTATNKALKWFVKIFLMFASEKVVTDFMKRVKNVAEEEAHTIATN